MPLHFDYRASKDFCEMLGLVWLGNEFMKDVDEEAWILGFDQQQMDAAIKHHLVLIHWLFTPANHGWFRRIRIAVYFLTGLKL